VAFGDRLTVDNDQITVDNDLVLVDGSWRLTAPQIILRLRSLIPAGWFAPDVPPLQYAVLGGIADVLTWSRDRITDTRVQSRLQSATGLWLDIAAWDFFGSRFMRRRAEPDDSFRVRILAEIFRPRNTRAAIIGALQDLTGRTPQLFEPWNPGDCGAYGIGTLAYGGGRINPPLITGYGGSIGGYGVGGLAYVLPSPPYGQSAGAGCYGSLSYPNQIFVTAYRPMGGGIPNVSGYGTPGGGYGVGAFAYVSLGQVASPVSDAEIYATVAATTAAGVVPWTAIQG
jgi:hypothetical protein